MVLLRALLGPVLLGIAAAPAAAAPAARVDVNPAVIGDWRTPATYRLTLTAGLAPEAFRLFVDGEVVARGPELVQPGGLGSAVTIGCTSRWATARANRPPAGYEVFTVALAPGASTFVEVRRRLVAPPLPGDALGFRATVAPLAPGAAAPAPEQVITHPGPAIRAPRGVKLGMHVIGGRRRARVSGLAVGLPAGERVTVYGFPPAGRARRVGTATVRAGGRFAASVRLPARGRWELYARYHSARPEIADDATPCGVPVAVR